MSKMIYVYENNSAGMDVLVGYVYVEEVNGKEVFAFEYADDWLTGHIGNVSFDPDINMYAGRQYLDNNKTIFGMLADSCPDRWGRMLMQRRESIIAQKEERHPRKLLESDFLLGVYDGARIGSLRYKLDRDADFLANDKNLAVPPWVALHKLENASWAFEQGESANEWLEILIAPGSSLGGARPKATVQDEKGNLWIAKFPSKNDEYDVGAWEMVVHDLAAMVGLNVPLARLEKFSEKGSTFLVKRFDRLDNRRLHFASAMTLLGKQDGEFGTSYLDLVNFICSYGVQVEQDLKELWKRVAFSMLVGNTDDHLRNHGFLLEQNGWHLSPIFDVNPVPYGNNLGLLINETSSLINEDLLLSTAKYYRLSDSEAKTIFKEMQTTVNSHWQTKAKQYKIKRNSIEYMQEAFAKML